MQSMFNKYILTYPILGRSGLGNMLLPWARCYIWSKDNNIPMIAPIWNKLRIGPYIRREKDKRNYQFLFDNKRYINGTERLFYLLFYKKVNECYKTSLSKNYISFKRKIIYFKGLQKYFNPIKGRNEEILSELKKYTKNRYLPRKIPKEFIGIHIRRGDFSIPISDEILFSGGYNNQIKIDWYISILNKIRNKLGYNIKAIIFSDAKKNELIKISTLPNIEISISNTAITDLLILSNASIMIASGSTFSMWASFLGQVPCVWFPGQRRDFLIKGNSKAYLEPEINYRGYIPNELLDFCKINGKI